MDNREDEMGIMQASKTNSVHQAKADKMQDNLNNKKSKCSSLHNSRATIPNGKGYDSYKHDSTSRNSYAKIMFQKPNVMNTDPQTVKFCGDEISSFEQVTDNASTQIDHDLIGFYKKKKKKKKGSENLKTHKVSAEKLGRLNSIEARLKFLESCTLNGWNTVDALENESICSTQNSNDEVEDYVEDDIRKENLDQPENMVQVMKNSKKVKISVAILFLNIK